MNDVVQGTRNGRLTSLIVALEHDTYRLFISRHVLTEVERDLPGHAADRGVDAVEAVRRWRRYYLQYVRIVDVPDEWGVTHPQVAEVEQRHPTDAPTARLAAALARCCVLTEDGDLTDYGFGSYDWLPLTHAGANHAEFELAVTAVGLPTATTSVAIWEVGRRFAQAPRALQATTLLLAASAAYWWQKDGRAERHLHQLKATGQRVWNVASPIAVELLTTYSTAVQTQAGLAVKPADVPALSERAARILALATDEGMLAREIADALGMTESPEYAAKKVRSALRSTTAFVEVSRGRWRLGCRVTTEPLPLPYDEQQEWMGRAVKYLLKQAAARALLNNETSPAG
ncbi:hypothetical protein KBX71_08840 [Micromonospora sp. D93]|uniref:hypothetical protein n=1 Tax=Micromonospora sp. D93 TaxID=2824886 RepID=UPI001B399A2A|nr:hypothetical protein [Micromonospora sp. D93]MBQ1017970.1 hypothetical protein [Micromonospora sp. D93]